MNLGKLIIVSVSACLCWRGLESMCIYSPHTKIRINSGSAYHSTYFCSAEPLHLKNCPRRLRNDRILPFLQLFLTSFFWHLLITLCTELRPAVTEIPVLQAVVTTFY